MARVLYASFDALPSPKGAGRHIEAVLGGLTGAGHAVDVCALSRAEWVAGARVVPFHSVEENFLARAGLFGEHVLSVAREGAYDVHHVRGIWEGAPLALTRFPHRPRLIYEVNGLPSIELPAHFPRLANQPAVLERLRRQEMLVIEAADLLLTPSPVTARCLVELGADPSRIRVVPNGVDLAHFRPAPGPATLPEVLYVGTFAPWQGLSTLLRAFRLVPPPVRLRLVGPPGKGWAADLRRLAGQLGISDRVVIQPPVAPSMVPEVFHQARVCVVPLDGSARNVIQGCCPLKLLESLACGRPVVASAVPPVEALVRHGEEAWLVAPDDPAALAEGLVRVLGDEGLQAGLSARGRALAESLSWESSNQKVLAAYDEVLARPAGAI